VAVPKSIPEWAPRKPRKMQPLESCWNQKIVDCRLPIKREASHPQFGQTSLLQEQREYFAVHRKFYGPKDFFSTFVNERSVVLEKESDGVLPQVLMLNPLARERRRKGKKDKSPRRTRRRK
jgi:hypothetical protein